jgi:hypothetical protein
MSLYVDDVREAPRRKRLSDFGSAESRQKSGPAHLQPAGQGRRAEEASELFRRDWESNWTKELFQNNLYKLGGLNKMSI